ncbi:hypothetical protein A3H85_00185 [Candidatus Daviesbacteria bacterium RIFCSPLOWO2_02_FULL_40_8]|uniref:Transposase IS200-like domain-containing protein n=1 Tax=Candidatus Daviesbacteria bacterium RIFCSPLOWO2_01_FULL_40_24 TaxID=1797787 RepID=A0A1F5MJR4_9BACT|nr:MAG: hypothetical protein A2780_01295 [Candidatus Daviesbacteria bacterium RIFCSPHIGHO2_01_FULL_41_45]OGE35504.1 MAG: hypothetical protein A3C32_03585 [Candidatus Daviesbacteria bacterium RIFCSPHIGHO2_02_FULL_41_14]OGE65595.1 MAG: hypothetical protein A3B49_02160 [Candidatus Daviesbacteria bacterium RIFCSPLOWO2_01_FULL_40_24]OGE66526.1 MAG: hypothetical protein A3H85_00185 [Candidatus Daviesbacteria bacterium RIFCSPLOWO2_02_FULL_40_8]
MPAKNSRKIYFENSYYHVYNRGVEKRIIFQDEQDYAVFIFYLKTYLLPKNEKGLMDKLANPNTSYKEKGNVLSLLKLNNFADEITLLAFCLMPNHFHLLIKQKSNNAMDKFLNSLGTRYTMYFNRKYKRVGRLYQDVYKAVLVNSDEQLLHLTRYIHRNPQPSLASKGQALRDLLLQQPSSYPEYLQERETEWVDTNTVLGFFSKNSPSLSYQSFVEQNDDYNIINNIDIDS